MTNEFDFEAVPRWPSNRLLSKASTKANHSRAKTACSLPYSSTFWNLLWNRAAGAGEMDGHLNQTRLTEQNRRNGKTTKQVKSSAGPLELQTPRDRTGSYQPQIVRPKRPIVLTPQLEQKVLSLYSVGNSYADISQHLLEMYGYSLSDSELTPITDKVIPAMREWQNRPLGSLYTLVWPLRRSDGWYLLQSTP